MSWGHLVRLVDLLGPGTEADDCFSLYIGSDPGSRWAVLHWAITTNRKLAL